MWAIGWSLVDGKGGCFHLHVLGEVLQDPRPEQHNLAARVGDVQLAGIVLGHPFECLAGHHLPPPHHVLLLQSVVIDIFGG